MNKKIITQALLALLIVPQIKAVEIQNNNKIAHKNSRPTLIANSAHYINNIHENKSIQNSNTPNNKANNIDYSSARVLKASKEIERTFLHWYYLKVMALSAGSVLTGLGTYWWWQQSAADYAKEQETLEAIKGLGANFFDTLSTALKKPVIIHTNLASTAENRAENISTIQADQQTADQAPIQANTNAPAIGKSQKILNFGTWLFEGTKGVISGSTKNAVQWWIGYNVLSVVRSALPNTGSFLNNIIVGKDIDWYINNHTHFQHTLKNNTVENNHQLDTIESIAVNIYKHLDEKAQAPVNSLSKIHDTLESFFKAFTAKKAAFLERLAVLIQNAVCDLEKINGYMLYRSNAIYKNQVKNPSEIRYKLQLDEIRWIMKSIQNSAQELIRLVSELSEKISFKETEEEFYEIQSDIFREISHFRDLEVKINI